jgi:hypothetical protein
MYARLSEARALAADAGTRARLDDLVLYARYVELYAAYETAVLGRQEAFDAVVRHARRSRARMMVYLHGLTEFEPKRNKRVNRVVVRPDDGAGDYDAGEIAEILRRGAGGRAG